MAADNNARIWAVVGASGTGKGVWVKKHLASERPARLVVWDFKAEYGEFAKLAPTLAAVHKAMAKAGGEGAIRIAYKPVGHGDRAYRREFEALCTLVQAWGNCCFVAEELAMVTTPGWAPGAWRQMTTGGRHEGIHIIGCTQTPATVDKSFLGNATLTHAGPLRERGHRLAVAQAMDIDEGRLAALVKFQWLEKDWDTNALTTGYTYPKGYGKRDTAAPAG